MLILAIDTTTLACSVALSRSGTVLAEITLNIKKTHSERLMPLIDRAFSESGIEREEIDAIAVAAGPGSFTGLRIGVATARALAQGLDVPVVAVNTLDALAEHISVPGALICPVLDARREQVYSALYRRDDVRTRELVTLIEPAALALKELTGSIIETTSGPVTFVGEGLQSYGAKIEALLPGRAVIAPGPFRLCRASLVAACGERLLESSHPSGDETSPFHYRNLKPLYLRQPEAERLAKERK